MSTRARLLLFALAGPGFAAVLVLGFRGLPDFGDYHGIYGLLADRLEPALRHATDIVTGVNFDLRAFDTLGEEFILFTSVTGVVLLLRDLRGDVGKGPQPVRDHRFEGASDALRVFSLPLVPLLIALGSYIVLHGTLTPGGGFQGGVILAAGPVALLIAGRYLAVKAVAPHSMLEAADALGAAGYALLGTGGLVFASIYLKNFLPFGSSGHLLSGGFIPLNSISVGLEVSGAFLLVWTEFLDQALAPAGGGS